MDPGVAHHTNVSHETKVEMRTICKCGKTRIGDNSEQSIYSEGDVKNDNLVTSGE